MFSSLSSKQNMWSKRCGHVSLWLVHVTLWLVGTCRDPLHLSPFLERGDIRSALELSEVRDPQKVIPKSYAGFITVDKQLGNHLFFWFFPAISEPLAPVLVWLNGGPTVSSMFGLLWENGPIRFTKDVGADGNKTSYKRWEKSWAESFAMLYIDNPVGTGYSYSDSGQRGWKTTNDGYTEDLFSFISQFYILFPDYLNTQLYIGGQSYAGKYVPSVAVRIHKEIKANRSSIPLAGIYLGGPLFDPFTQSVSQGRFYYSLGAISYAQYLSHQKSVRQLFDRNDTRRESMRTIFQKLTSVIPYIDSNYHTGEHIDYDLIQDLMNTRHIRQMVHVGDQLEFKVSNRALKDKYAPDVLISTKPQLTEIMGKYKVLIYSGDFDGIVTAVNTEEAILSTPWSLQCVYNESDRHIWKYDSTVVGYYTHVGGFCRVIVRNAGHQTPHDQPDITQKMMLDFVRHGCIQQGASKLLLTFYIYLPCHLFIHSHIHSFIG
ncbi:unnamed protein product [Candidula unifasciata]|uniref:Serine carboxypeptidase CPVL n=1 Tax=Candidula unifasciata TaxID=100452 RepID=A0A8S3ZLP2_9EUPU|nr:unnamed protein product [Candidula unifasciata]